MSQIRTSILVVALAITFMGSLSQARKVLTSRELRGEQCALTNLRTGKTQIVACAGGASADGRSAPVCPFIDVLNGDEVLLPCNYEEQPSSQRQAPLCEYIDLRNDAPVLRPCYQPEE